MYVMLSRCWAATGDMHDPSIKEWVTHNARVGQTVEGMGDAQGLGPTLGGSRVILTPRCRTAAGNPGLGMEVSQRRKSLWQVSGLMPSTMRSRLGIQLTARWQFCRHTHCPFSMPRISTFSACRRDKKRRDYAFRHQSNKKLSRPGCPGSQPAHTLLM